MDAPIHRHGNAFEHHEREAARLRTEREDYLVSSQAFPDALENRCHDVEGVLASTGVRNCQIGKCSHCASQAALGGSKVMPGSKRGTRGRGEVRTWDRRRSGISRFGSSVWIWG